MKTDPESEKEEEEKDSESKKNVDGIPIHKDPSFSYWCSDDEEEEEDVEEKEDDDEEYHHLSPIGSAICEDSESESESIAGDNEFELPLLHTPTGSARSAASYFRQRSTPDRSSGSKRYHPFDVEAGLRPSESKIKLDSLEHSVATSLTAVAVIKTVFYILVWYTFSTCLTIYNKNLLGDKLGKFPAPLLMNTVHFGLQAFLSKLIMCFQSRAGDGSVPMTWRDYFFRVVPTAIGTALDINLSNASLVFISVTFATMCKSASPIFLLLFAFAFRLESPSIRLLGIMLIISIGVLLTVARETEFDFWGFIFVMLAAVMSGFRWSMTQILLQKEAYGLKNPITLMGYVSPVMAIGTAILSLLMDPWHDFPKNIYFDSLWHTLRSCALMLIGGSLAFLMVLTEYILISATSAVTVTIAGVVKEAVTILVAVFYFHEQFTLLKGLGLLTIMIGVSLFNWYKYQKFKKGQASENEELIPSNPNATSNYVIFDDIDFQDDDT